MGYSILTVSLGCNKNRVDAEEMLGLLRQAGHTIVSDESKAEVAIINTCGFIQSAKEESIDEILHFADLKAKGKLKYIIVTGCLSQRYYKELLKEIPEADAFVGVTAFDEIVEAVNHLADAQPHVYMKDINLPCPLSLPRITDPIEPYAYLKIAEGCDNRCSYCAIPYIRGSYRSKPQEILIEEAKELAARGKKEIILVAQDITRYGQDLAPGINLLSLLKELSKIEGIAWLRLMYLNPARISFSFLDVLTQIPKVLHYYDIPVQHISDTVLRDMHREALGEKIRDLFQYIKSTIPDSSLRTTFITGFPGETEEDFQQLYEFVKNTDIDNLGVFPYSAEEGTPAAKRKDQIPHEIAVQRADAIMALQKKRVSAKNAAKAGKITQAMIEKVQRGGHFIGRTPLDAPEIDGRIYITGQKKLQIGDIVPVKILRARGYDTFGELLHTNE